MDVEDIQMKQHFLIFRITNQVKLKQVLVSSPLFHLIRVEGIFVIQNLLPLVSL